MAHHRKKGPQSTRSACMMCKPHKHQANKDSFHYQTEQVKKHILIEKEQLADLL